MTYNYDFVATFFSMGRHFVHDWLNTIHELYSHWQEGLRKGKDVFWQSHPEKI